MKKLWISTFVLVALLGAALAFAQPVSKQSAAAWWNALTSGTGILPAANGGPGYGKVYTIVDLSEDTIDSTIALIGSNPATIHLGPGTWPLTTIKAFPNDVSLEGSGSGTVLDVTGITNSVNNLITMGDYSRLGNLKISGSINPLPVNGMDIKMGNYSEVHDLWIESHAGGIETSGKIECRINRVRFNNIYDASGYAHCIHASSVAGVAANGVYIDGIYATNCDRGIEVENTATNIYAKNGYMYNIIPSAGAVNHYSFVLDVHSHSDGNGAPSNVFYENFYVGASDGLTSGGSTGFNTAYNINFKNITIVNPVPSASRPILSSSSAQKVTFEDIKIIANFGTLIAQDSYDTVFNRLDVRNGQTSSILLTGATNTKILNSSFNNSGTGFAASQTGGTYTTYENNRFWDITSTGGLQVSASATYQTMRNNLYIAKTGSVGTYGLKADGGSPFRAYNEQVIGSPTYAYSITCNDTIIDGGYFSGAAGSYSIWVRAGATGVVIRNAEVNRSMLFQGDRTVVFNCIGQANTAMAFADDLSIINIGTLGSESLTNPNLTSGTSWSAANDCALAANAATWAFSGGAASTLTQVSATLAVAGAPNRLYTFTYTLSGLIGAPTASITTSFAAADTPLIMTAGAHTVYFYSAAAPGDFVITSTLIAGKGFTLDTFSLKEVQGGNISSHGLFTGGGTTGLRIKGNGSFAVPATVATTVTLTAGTTTTVANTSITAVSQIFPVPKGLTAAALGVYVSDQTAGVGYTLTHGIAAGTETVNVLVLN